MCSAAAGGVRRAKTTLFARRARVGTGCPIPSIWTKKLDTGFRPGVLAVRAALPLAAMMPARPLAFFFRILGAGPGRLYLGEHRRIDRLDRNLVADVALDVGQRHHVF